jgi:signal transduction histidine kinase
MMATADGGFSDRVRLIRRRGGTARRRLTLLYAGTFLLLGTLIILVTFLLVSSDSTIAVQQALPTARAVSPQSATGQTTANPVPLRIRPGISSAIRHEVGRQHSADLSRLLAISWVVLAVTAVAAALFGWFASGRVLRPLREMAATARTISAGSLSERLALQGAEGDEFKQLGDTLDDLLARLEASFEAQRRFVANASHELRTPLTLERTLLQVALADPSASAATLRATCEELLAAGRHHERLLEALLVLATSERGLEAHEPVDLADLAGKAVHVPRLEAQGRSLRVATALAPAVTTGDPALVERLIANLIDNAVHYNVAGGEVEVRTGTEADRATLVVTNGGPVVPADEVERLFEPFQRLDGRGAGADGRHGLGLSIVRAIAAAHDATATARPRAEGGLVVTVSFPGRLTLLTGAISDTT